MSNKSFIPTLLLAIFTWSLQAQTVKPAAPEQSGAEAKKVLDRIRKKYEGYKSFEAAFTLTIEVPEQPKEVQKGVIGQAGDQFRLEMPDQVIVDNTKTTWVYLKKNNEVQINDSEPSSADAGFLTPKELLRRYQKGDFLYDIVDKVSDGARVLTLIEFKPVDRKSEYSKLRIAIDEKAGTIQYIKAFEKVGTRYTFTVTRFSPNKALAADYFTFDPKKYPGVRVEDLRM